MTVPTPDGLDRLKKWLLEPQVGGPQVGGRGAPTPVGAEQDDPLLSGSERPTPRTTPWWRVLSLPGVDALAFAGYQPSVAFLAAGALSPVATLVLALVILVGVLPVYRQVARESSHGDGSIHILERLLPWWPGKIMVLVLIGFLMTDLILTVTLSAAAASVHVVGSPLVADVLSGRQPGLTLVLVLLLGGMFLRGFRLSPSLALPVVAAYVALSGVVIIRGLIEIAARPDLLLGWRDGLLTRHGDPLAALAVAALLFPRLVLGLAGFETGRHRHAARPGRPRRRLARLPGPRPRHAAASGHRWRSS
jgi:hypothetical protein